MRRRALLALLLLASACSEKDSPPAVAVTGEELLFSTTDYTLAPGEEKYMCWTQTLPADRSVAVREISGDYGDGVHHVFFAWTLTPEPEGMHECQVLFKTTWIPIYLGGKDTSPLVLPEKAGIDLGKGKQLVLQLHLQNTTEEPIHPAVTMHMKLNPEGETFDPAGVFGLDNRTISLPASTNGVHSSMSCKPGKEMNVFSVLGHMHKLGDELQISRNGEVVFDQPWDFDEQPITPLSMTVGKDDTLSLDCTHSNPLPKQIPYGESSDTEMCATILYYTPYDGLDGCVKAPSTGDAGASGSGDGGPRVVGDGACTNDADLALVDTTPTGDAIRTCGTGCLGQAVSCATDCISKDSGLSAACSGCYAAMVDCTIAQCLSDCAAAPDGAACETCRATQCVPAFTTCSGLSG